MELILGKPYGLINQPNFASYMQSLTQGEAETDIGYIRIDRHKCELKGQITTFNVRVWDTGETGANRKFSMFSQALTYIATRLGWDEIIISPETMYIRLGGPLKGLYYPVATACPVRANSKALESELRELYDGLLISNKPLESIQTMGRSCIKATELLQPL